MTPTLKSVLVGSARRISIDDFNIYLDSIGAPPYGHDGKSGFITIRDVAAWLNVSGQTVYNMVYAYENEPLQVTQSKRVVA